MILIDTTVLIDALRNRNQRRGLLEAWVLRGEQLATSAMNVAEIYSGCRPREEVMTRALLAGLVRYAITPEIAERAGLMKAALMRAGQTCSIADMMVAATALEHGMEVATDNVKDFQLPGLKLIQLP